MSFADFIESVQIDSIGIKEVIAIVVLFFYDFLWPLCLEELLPMAVDFMGSVLPYLGYIIIGVSLLFVFFGRKLLWLIRFLGFFAAGAVLGLYLLGPIVTDAVDIPEWVVALVTGIIAAVLSKLVYYLFVAIVSGGALFVPLYFGLIPLVDGFTADNWVGSLIVTGVAVIILFVLLKYIEIIGTAMLGGWGIGMVVLVKWWHFETLFSGNFALALLVFSAVVALPGIIVQMKTRKRYV